MRRRDLVVYVLMGILLGIAVILLVNLLIGLVRGGDPCPVSRNHTPEGAQVFLMGTICGEKSDPERDCWRESGVQPLLDDPGVTYYNPVVENWTDENAAEEAQAIASAETIVLVITADHPSIGSLSESGWAVLSALEREQQMIAYIAPASDNVDSLRARQIVLSQAQPLAERFDRLTLTHSLDAVNAELKRLCNR